MAEEVPCSAGEIAILSEAGHTLRVRKQSSAFDSPGDRELGISSMNVLHLLNSLGVGGAEKMVLSLCQRLKCHGEYLPIVCSLTDTMALVEEFRENGIPVHCLEKIEKFDPSVPIKLARIVRAKHIGIVHTHNVGAWIYGGISKLLTTRNLVHTEHSNVSCDERRRLILERILSQISDKIVCDSDDVARFMVTVQKVNSERLTIIWNGVKVGKSRYPKDSKKKAQLGLGDKFVVGNVARLVPVKDHSTLLKAFRILKDHVPNSHLLLVGDGPCRPQIEQASAQMRLSDDVTITGFVKDVGGFLQALDLFVLSSVSEGISIALLEAMACGVPVVATAVGGNPEVVLDNDSGLLVPSNDPISLGNALVAMAKDKLRREEMGNRAFERVVECFSLDAMTQSYIDVYRQLSAGGRK